MTTPLSPLARAYKQEQARRSGSALYRLPGAPAPQRQIYGDSPAHGGLEQYQSGSVDPLAQRPGESAEGWRRRVQAVVRHLPEDEAAARLAAIEQAGQVQTHDQLRTQLGGRQAGNGRGVFGAATPQDRAGIVGGRFGGRKIQGQGYLAPMALATPGQHNPMMTSTAAYAAAREREAKARGQQPQHTDVSQLRSSGEGWMTR